MFPSVAGGNIQTAGEYRVQNAEKSHRIPGIVAIKAVILRSIQILNEILII